ncbi:MAG: hypothetical protein PHN80_09220 [Hespellia sp.]|nr:hypothetical protein [Hespellia sp.]
MNEIKRNRMIHNLWHIITLPKKCYKKVKRYFDEKEVYENVIITEKPYKMGDCRCMSTTSQVIRLTKIRRVDIIAM